MEEYLDDEEEGVIVFPCPTAADCSHAHITTSTST